MTDPELIERLRELAQWSADRHGYHVCDKDKTVAAMLEAQAADRLAALIAELDEAQENGANWFNAFQSVSEWLGHRDWWLEKDIHPTNPAQTLITGLERKEIEIAALKADLILAQAKNIKLQTLVRGRDTFIANQGLWNDFNDALGYPKETEHYVRSEE